MVSDSLRGVGEWREVTVRGGKTLFQLKPAETQIKSGSLLPAYWVGGVVWKGQ